MRRSLMTLITLVLIALPVMADEPLPQPVQVVATILQLQPDQLMALVTMIQQREAALQPLRQQLQAHQQSLAAALQSANPDATVIGQLLIETRAIERQAGAVTAQAAAQFEQVLTPEQIERLHGIRGAAQVCPIVPAFEAVGLL